MDAQIHTAAAHDKKHHDLGRAHSPTYAVHGQTVYVICGWYRCVQRLEVDAAVWRAEEGRRREEAGWPEDPEAPAAYARAVARRGEERT